MSTLIVFYSYPIEASLTAIFRGLEVCNPRSIVIVSTKRRASEVEELLSILRSMYSDIELYGYSDIPDIETSLEDIPKVIDKVKELLKMLSFDEICFVSSAGSRIEISSLMMVLDRSKSNVLYISFTWGPWKGSFYPYTPKPLEIVHEVHGFGVLPRIGSDITFVDTQLIDKMDISSIRRETLLTQLYLNKHIVETPCYATRDSVDCSCRSLTISIIYRKTAMVVIDIEDYCSWNNVLKSIDKLTREVDDLRDRIPDEVYKVLKLLLNVSGIYLPVVRECSYGCPDLENTILLDVLRNMNRVGIIDTNIVYQGIHNQLYEYIEEAYRYLEIPLCLYIEMYEHQAHIDKPYNRIRSTIAQLLIEELKKYNLPIAYQAAYKPCEVGIALASKRNSIAITSDRHAYERLLKTMNIDSILTIPKPLTKTRFLHNEKSRRISYAYYAIAQLKALTKILKTRNELQTIDLDIDIHMK